MDLRRESWQLSLRLLITNVYVAFEGDFKAYNLNTDFLKALIDGPATKTKTAVPRQAIALSQLILTPLVLENLPRGARTGAVNAQWEKAGIETKWQESTWAKKRSQKERRRALTDFERFKVMRLRKQARFEVRKSLAKVKSSA
jgi:large subunit ribosomal protein L14e